MTNTRRSGTNSSHQVALRKMNTEVKAVSASSKGDTGLVWLLPGCCRVFGSLSTTPSLTSLVFQNSPGPWRKIISLSELPSEEVAGMCGVRQDHETALKSWVCTLGSVL